jgi:hypothetical protein
MENLPTETPFDGIKERLVASHQLSYLLSESIAAVPGGGRANSSQLCRPATSNVVAAVSWGADAATATTSAQAANAPLHQWRNLRLPRRPD